MKREELKKMIGYYEAVLQRVKQILDERYYELEEKNEERKWIDELKKQKVILQWLNEQVPDDE